jgi:alpha-galactosidase
MAAVVDYVHSKGLTFGLYTCAGTETCVGRRPGSKVLRAAMMMDCVVLR